MTWRHGTCAPMTPKRAFWSASTLGSLNGNPASGGLAEEAADYDHLLLIGPVIADYFTTPGAMPGVVVEPLYTPMRGRSQTAQPVRV